MMRTVIKPPGRATFSLSVQSDITVMGVKQAIHDNWAPIAPATQRLLWNDRHGCDNIGFASQGVDCGHRWC